MLIRFIVTNTQPGDDKGHLLQSNLLLCFFFYINFCFCSSPTKSRFKFSKPTLLSALHCSFLFMLIFQCLHEVMTIFFFFLTFDLTLGPLGLFMWELLLISDCVPSLSLSDSPLCFYTYCRELWSVPRWIFRIVFLRTLLLWTAPLTGALKMVVIGTFSRPTKMVFFLHSLGNSFQAAQNMLDKTQREGHLVRNSANLP